MLTEKDVALGRLVMALAHQLFLDPVLEIFDFDELGPAFPNFPGHRLCDVSSRRRITVNRQKRLTHGVLDLVLIPRDNVPIAPNYPGCDLWHAASVGSTCALAVPRRRFCWMMKLRATS